MSLGGLWHGAAWSYAIWGLYHGLLLAAERVIQSHKINVTSSINNIFQRIFVFLMVSMGWLLFKLPDFSEVLMYLKTLFTNPFFDNRLNDIIYIFIYSLPVFFYHLLYLSQQKGLLLISLPKLKPLIYSIMLYFLITNSGSSMEFIYFQF